MHALTDKLKTIEFRRIIWIIPIVTLLHELEEWNIIHWYQRFYSDLPEFTDLSIRTWLIFFSLCFFVWWGISLMISKSPKITAYLILPPTILIFQNGIQHGFWTIYFGAYSPGVVFGFLFGVPACMYVIYRALHEKLAQVWYVSILVLAIIPGIIETYRVGNTQTAAIRGISEFGIWLSSFLI